MRLKWFATAGIAVAIISAFVACSRTDRKPANQVEKITIACATPPYTVLVDIALAKGYFRQEGLECTPRFYSTGKESLEEVLAGKSDFATVAETPVMFAAMNGNRISIIATIQSSTRTDVIMARKDKGIRIPEDLKGKRIAASRGTIAEYFLYAFLAAHGIAGAEVTVVNLKPEEMPSALTSGAIDAASMFPPFQNQAQQMLGDNGLTFYEKDIYTQTFNLVASQLYIGKNPSTIRKVLLALMRAEEFIKSQPAEAQKIVADFRQTDPAVLSMIWSANIYDASLDQSLLLALEDESRWAIKNKLTTATKIPNYLDYIYLDGLKAVKPHAVRILR